MHEYDLIEKCSGRKVLGLRSRTKIDISIMYVDEIRDGAAAIYRLIQVDRDVADKYELRYAGYRKERPGWCE